MSRHDDDERTDEVLRLRQAVAVARFWLEQFADPAGFVWLGDRSPHEHAAEAVETVRQSLAPPSRELTVEAVGTGRIERLRRGRSGFVEFHQTLARQALAMGQPGAARAALRALRATDFAGHAVDAHFATLRDGTATRDAVTEAATALAALPPTPVSEELD